MRVSTLVNILACAPVAYGGAEVNFGFASSLIGELEAYKIIPDVLPTTFAPKITLSLADARADGSSNIFRSPLHTGEPVPTYEGDPSKYYTLVLVNAGDPTIPGHSNKLTRNWLVVNIRGSDINSGNSIGVPYADAEPPKCSIARYVYALAEQSEKLAEQTAPVSRESFDLVGYFAENKMTLVGANYFFAMADSAELCPGASLTSFAKRLEDDAWEKEYEEDKCGLDSEISSSAAPSSDGSSVDSSSVDNSPTVTSSHSQSAVRSASGSQPSQPNGASGNGPAAFTLPMAVVFVMAAVGATNYL